MALDVFRCDIISDALQHFAGNDADQPESLPIKFGMNPLCLSRCWVVDLHMKSRTHVSLGDAPMYRSRRLQTARSWRFPNGSILRSIRRY